MNGAVTKVVILPKRSALLGIADGAVAQRLAHEIERFAGVGSVTIASSLLQLHQSCSHVSPDVILLDHELLGRGSLGELVRQLRMAAPVILLAPTEQQAVVAHLVAAGDVDFVARAG